MDWWFLAWLDPQNRLHRSWRAAVEALALWASPTTRTPVRFVGQLDEVELELFHEPGTWALAAGTTVVRARSPLSLSLSLGPRAQRGIRCGDERFDSQVRIEGDPLEAAALDPTQREALWRHLHRRPGTGEVHRGWLTTRFPGQLREATTLVRTARRLTSLAARLEDERSLLERVAARVHSEPRWQSRRAAVESLAAAQAPAGLIEPALSDPHGQVRVAAALALGREVPDLSGGLTLPVSSGALSLPEER